MSGSKNVMLFVGLGVLVPLAFVLLQPATVDGAVEWTEKVDPWVLDQLDAQDEAEFLVFLRDQADVSGAAELGTKAERGKYVFERLAAAAARARPASRRAHGPRPRASGLLGGEHDLGPW